MDYKKIIPVSISLLLMLSSAWGQYAENIAYSKGSEQSSNKPKYYITYNLTAPYENIPCQVKVKLTTGTKGERILYLKEVTGDVGNLVYPGLNKEIIWDYVEELVHFSAEISLSIEVTPSVQVPAKIKKGKQLTVSLAPIYTPNKSYAVKLYQAVKEVTRLNDVLLIEKSFPVLIPKKTKVKKKYQLAITDGEKTYFSNVFKVKPKIAYGWIIVPVMAVPAYILINQTIEDNQPLPGPPTIP